MSDEQVEYHVSITVTKVTTVDGRREMELVSRDKWPHMASTFPNEPDALECAQILKGFLLGM